MKLCTRQITRLKEQQYLQMRLFRVTGMVPRSRRNCRKPSLLWPPSAWHCLTAGNGPSRPRAVRTSPSWLSVKAKTTVRPKPLIGNKS